jgi:hypothetical protein
VLEERQQSAISFSITTEEKPTLMHHDRQLSHTGPRPSTTNMTTNRPFFSNFLAAFRAQSAFQKAASPSAAAAYSHTPTTTSHTTSHPTATTARTITTKAGASTSGSTTAAVQATAQFQPTRQHTAPYHRSTSPTTKAFPIPGASRRDRRGSDSSNEGFLEVMGADKWYIGGRTAAGEEKFYKLGMVKRHRSVDRLSLDRLSI